MNLEPYHEILRANPAITLSQLEADLSNYYEPYVKHLVILHQKNPGQGLIVGVSAIQGTGKTTQGKILEVLLSQQGLSAISLSIDDHYITHQQLNKLRLDDPRFIRRGVTHDIDLAMQELTALQNMKEEPILISQYDKGAHLGDGDRFAWIELTPGVELHCSIQNSALHLEKAFFNQLELKLPLNMGAQVEVSQELLSRFSSGEVIIKAGDQISKTENFPVGWRLITKKPDIIFYDGWMLGVKPVKDESVFDLNLPALETPEDRQFAKDINRKLVDYLPLWQMIDYLNCLYVPNYSASLRWREQAEKSLRAKGLGMSEQEVIEFVHYFWRSVHPAIHIHALALDPQTDQVVLIDDDHSIKKVYLPGDSRADLP